MSFRNNLIPGISFGFSESEKIVFESQLNFDIQHDIIVSNNNQVYSDKIGEINYNAAGSQLEIIDYKKSDNIVVMITSVLPTGEIKKYIRMNCTYQNFNRGEIGSPYDVSFYGHGYNGEGPYSKTTHKKYYMHYSNMMLRSYDMKYKMKNPTYNGVSVDEYFYNFQNFGYWSDFNYYEINGERMNLDKDIVIKGNKLYSPYTCIFVPEYINKMFLVYENKKSGLPKGCVYSRSGNNYQSTMIGSKTGQYLGKFSNPMDAAYAYKGAKEKEIKRVANDYYFNKGGKYIPQFQFIYQILMNYEVDV